MATTAKATPKATPKAKAKAKAKATPQVIPEVVLEEEPFFDPSDTLMRESVEIKLANGVKIANVEINGKLITTDGIGTLMNNLNILHKSGEADDDMARRVMASTPIGTLMNPKSKAGASHELATRGGYESNHDGNTWKTTVNVMRYAVIKASDKIQNPRLMEFLIGKDSAYLGRMYDADGKTLSKNVTEDFRRLLGNNEAGLDKKRIQDQRNTITNSATSRLNKLLDRAVELDSKLQKIAAKERAQATAKRAAQPPRSNKQKAVDTMDEHWAWLKKVRESDVDRELTSSDTWKEITSTYTAFKKAQAKIGS
jgi:hypothetical protein